jgi:hypothetical protein
MSYLTRNSPGLVFDMHHGVETYDGHACGGESWKLDVGAQCNRTLALAAALEQIEEDEPNRLEHIGIGSMHAADLRALVERVATFEELETE